MVPLLVPLVVLTIVAYCFVHGLSYSAFIDRLWAKAHEAPPIVLGALIFLGLVVLLLRRKTQEQASTKSADDEQDGGDRG